MKGKNKDYESEFKEEGYLELDTDAMAQDDKLVVRPFTLTDFEELRGILDSLREGHTVCLINIKPLKEQDILELRRAINKLKKTCDAINGEIAGFGEDYIVAVPSRAKIYRSKGGAMDVNADEV